MANPQLEDGYTSIANEILERLALIKISATDWRVLVTIIRRTYGFHKKVDWIANFQITQSTGLCKAVVSRSLARLKEDNLILRNGKTIGFQKDWDQWKLAEQSTNEKLAEQSTNEKLAEQSTYEGKLAIQSTEVSDKSLQISQQKLAIQSTELAIQSTKVSSCAVAQKIKDNIQKIKDKGEPSSNHLFNILKQCPEINDSDAYKLPELLNDYPGINYELEFKKFIEWWPGPNKRKKPWAVLRNWLGRISVEERPLMNSGVYKDL